MTHSYYTVVSRDRDGSEYVNETDVNLKFEDLVTRLGDGSYGYDIAYIDEVNRRERRVNDVTFSAIAALADRYNGSDLKPGQDVRDMISAHSEYLGWHLER